MLWGGLVPEGPDGGPECLFCPHTALQIVAQRPHDGRFADAPHVLDDIEVGRVRAPMRRRVFRPTVENSESVAPETGQRLWAGVNAGPVR